MARQLLPRDKPFFDALRDNRLEWLDHAQAKHFPDLSAEGVKSLLRRYRGRGGGVPLIASAPLDANRAYYYLTRYGAGLLDAPSWVARPLGPTALIRQYARVSFFDLAGATRWACQPQDFPDVFNSTKGRQPPRGTYHVEQKPNGETHLGASVVDYGTDTRRLAHRVAELAERFTTSDTLLAMLRMRRVEIYVLTLSDGKAASARGLARRVVAKRFSRKSAPAPEVNAYVVPRLIDLIPGANTRGPARHE